MGVISFLGWRFEGCDPGTADGHPTSPFDDVLTNDIWGMKRGSYDGRGAGLGQIEPSLPRNLNGRCRISYPTFDGTAATDGNVP